MIKFKGYDDFACYTPAANRAMANHCKTFIKKINKSLAAGDNEKTTRQKFCNAMKAYINSYQRFTNSNIGKEGGAIDTDVREGVWSVCSRIGHDLGYKENFVDFLWNKHYD